MTETQTPDPVRGPGATLAAERESRGIGPQEICDQLNFSSAVLSKLEADDYEALPPAAFVRGYLRSYARFLEVDPEPVIASYNEIVAVNDESPTSSPSVPREPRSSDPLMRVATVAIAVLLLLAGIYWWLGNNAESVVDRVSEDQASAAPVAEQPVELAEEDADFPPDSELFRDSADGETEPMEEAGVTPAVLAVSDAEIGEPASEAESASEEDAPAESLTALESDIDAESAAETPPASEPEPEEVISEAAVAEAPEVGSESTDAGSVLLLQAQEESWVSVIDANQDRLMYGMLTSGTPRKLEGDAPFEIILGVGEGITISFNGTDVDFSSHVRRSRTARFILDADGSTRRLP